MCSTKRLVGCIVSVLLLLTILPLTVYAEVPQRMNYQGYLTNPAGNPVADGSYNMIFSIYDVAVGGADLWSESQAVTVTKGVYDVHIGVSTGTNPFPANLFKGNRYLGVTVGTDDEMTPRQLLTTTAFSMHAADADTLDGMDSASFSLVGHSHSFADITGSASDAQIPDSITINYAATANSANTAISATTAGYAVTAGSADTADTANSATTAGYATTAGDADTVDGEHASAFANSSHTHDSRYYTEGESNSRFVNVTGDSMSGSTSGSVLSMTNTGTGYGVSGYATSGVGVYGLASNTGDVANYGGYFLGRGESGRGVSGYATNTAGGNYGGYFEAWGSFGNGVYGEASGIFGVGVRGEASGNYGFGVRGETWGESGIGVYGEASGFLGHAGYFKGNVRVTGYLTKAGGGFQIDHPLEPDNKYLNHSFVESPDMMNIYNGNVVLNHKGEAWVELPEWFETLNKDFRYQLTCIGGFAKVYIAQEITDNRFKIAGGEPEIKVSWQVTGIRQDPWANANRLPVEEDKTDKELGYYLHPESYGQPEEKGIEWARDPEGMQRMKEKREKHEASTN